MNGFLLSMFIRVLKIQVRNNFFEININFYDKSLIFKLMKQNFIITHVILRIFFIFFLLLKDRQAQ
jgi:hypothetical protein